MIGQDEAWNPSPFARLLSAHARKAAGTVSRKLVPFSFSVCYPFSLQYALRVGSRDQSDTEWADFRSGRACVIVRGGVRKRSSSRVEVYISLFFSLESRLFLWWFLSTRTIHWKRETSTGQTNIIATNSITTLRQYITASTS